MAKKYLINKTSTKKKKKKTVHKKKMEFSHVFYKELPLDNDNIFSANLTENNKVERIKFDKSKLFAISGLSIDQTVDRTVLLPNAE